MMDRKKQRIVVIIIAVILAATMILSLAAPALAEASYESAAAESVEAAASAAKEADVSASAAADAEGAAVSRLADGRRILEGVKIGNLDVSGLTSKEAAEKVEEAVKELSEHVLTAEVSGREFTVPIAELGCGWDNPEVVGEAVSQGLSGNLIARFKKMTAARREGIDLPLNRSYDENKLRAFLRHIADEIYVEPVESELIFQGTEPYVTEGSDGEKLDVQSAFSHLMIYLSSGWTEGEPRIELKTQKIGQGERREELLKIRDRLGVGETDAVGSQPERMQNIMNAMELISDTMLEPGESFSTLEKLVPFTAENGYALAHSYEEGAVVDTYGGGICQVSTTLYQAVMAAELEVNERSSHSMIVGYVEPSRDAAISESGGKDFIFTNNTSAPIYIKGSVNGTILRFDIFGLESRPGSRQISYRTKILAEEPASAVFTADPDKPVGYIRLDQEPHRGLSAELYKDIVTDGQEAGSELYNTSDYIMSPARYTVGTGGAEEELLADLEEAFDAESFESLEEKLNNWEIEITMTTLDQELAEMAARAAAGENPEGEENPESGENAE
ncbi:MAG: VanW family protein [Lachnospiraceae bacterium]|nr:VanW family protein [Lachnospiraceae bacterium]